MNNSKIEYGSRTLRLGNDFLSEIAFIERKAESMRVEVMKGIRRAEDGRDYGFDGAYLAEKIEKIKSALENIERGIQA